PRGRRAPGSGRGLLYLYGRLVSTRAHRQKKRARVPLLLALGVCADGRRVVLDMRSAGHESEAAWCELMQSLVAHHLGTPTLAGMDGNRGLRGVLRAQWDYDPTLYQPQATQPAGQDAGTPARGSARGLPAHGI